MASPNNKFDTVFIGYSALVKFEQAYVYSENACFIADEPQSAIKYAEDCFFSARDCRIDTIKVLDLINDYGCSCGQYLLEPKALERFEKVAKSAGIEYRIEREDEWGMIPEGWGLIEIDNYRREWDLSSASEESF